MCRWLMLSLLLALAASTARAEPLNTLRDPYGTCDQQTLETGIALERSGDRDALRDHVRSFGCKLIWPRQGFDPWYDPSRERQHGEEREKR